MDENTSYSAPAPKSTLSRPTSTTDNDAYELLNDWPSKHGFRFMDKNGHINIQYSSMGQVRNMHANIFLFIMQARWWLVLTCVLHGFLISWFFFAFLYFLVSIEHGDFVLTEEEQAELDRQNHSSKIYGKIQHEMCVKEVHNFLSALLFSIETQHTIGYGSRYITTECLGGILVLTLQSSLGYLLQVIVTQIVFSKLSRPTENSQFIVFSNFALIAPRNNQLTLTFRIGNLSLSQLIFASVRLLMIRPRRTSEGELILHQIYDMELTRLRNGQLFFPRPTVIEHIIDARSPLYGIQPRNLAKEQFEIIAIIEGCFDYTGFSCHFRTSYLPNEILWGYRFSSCDSTLHGFDYKKFNHVELIDDIPLWHYQESTSNGPSTPMTPSNSPFEQRKHPTSNEQFPFVTTNDTHLLTVPSASKFELINDDDDEKEEVDENDKLLPDVSQRYVETSQ